MLDNGRHKKLLDSFGSLIARAIRCRFNSAVAPLPPRSPYLFVRLTHWSTLREALSRRIPPKIEGMFLVGLTPNFLSISAWRSSRRSGLLANLHQWLDKVTNRSDACNRVGKLDHRWEVV